MIATVLSAIGLFSVIPYTVSQSTREIGIMMAFGADKKQVLKSVLTPVVTAILLGLILGIVLSISASRAISHWTEVSISNPLVLTAAALLALVVGLFATFVPAVRATLLQPMDALRTK